MDAVLIGVTVVALGVAFVMSAIAWRLSQEDRRRTTARVAALAAAAQLPPPVDTPSTVPAAVARPWREVRDAPTASVASEDTAASHAPAAGQVAVSSGFLASPEPPSNEGAWGLQRGLAVAAVVFAVLLTGFAVSRVGLGSGGQAGAPTPAPLELLSLRHDREGALLSVSGLVRNPAGAPAVEGVSAVVMLFDAQGDYVTSSTAPVDFVRLASGDESPFVVKMQAPSTVARYRVSFRTDAGRLTHVDRRTDETGAAAVALTER